jgi:hypothetical protein
VSRRFFNRDVNSQADFHAASPSQWQLACQREAVIRPLAETDRLSCLQVDRAAKVLGLGRSVTYRLIARFRQRPRVFGRLWLAREPSISSFFGWRILCICAVNNSAGTGESAPGQEH